MPKHRKVQSPVAREAERFMNKAMGALLDEGNWLKSVQYLQQAMVIDPSYLPPYYELTDIYLQIGHVEAAIGVVQKALKMDAHDYQNNFNLANIYLVQGKVDEALAIYRKLERVFKDSSPDLLFNVATAYHTKGQRQLALRYVQRVLGEDPSYLEGFELKGKILFEQGNFPGAKAALRKVLELERNHVSANHLLGVIYSRESRWRAAIKVWRKAVTFSPNNDETLRELGWAYKMVGDEEHALAMLKKALELNPENLQARIDLGVIYLGQFRIEDALAQWEVVRQSDPDNKFIRTFLSQVERSSKKRKDRDKNIHHILSSLLPSHFH
ncbi:MAG TPA: tetratricopeptide repeat protein [Nitrospiria bacterium]|jgi:tetratricopeptide (TPR) repeat protein